MKHYNLSIKDERGTSFTFQNLKNRSNSNSKLRKNHILFTALLFLLSNAAFAINPPKVIKQISTDNSNVTEDWLYGIIEDTENKNIISCGFTEGSTDYKKPAVVALTSDLKPIWHYYMSESTLVYDESNYTWNGIFDAGTTLRDIIQVGDYYYACGYVKLKSTATITTTVDKKPILFKFDKEGNLQSGFPKAYNVLGWSNTNNSYNEYDEIRAYSITYDPGNDNLYLAGSTGGFVWLAKINGTSYALSNQTDFNKTGCYFGMTRIYSTGSLYGDRPNSTSATLEQIALCGRQNTGYTTSDRSNALISRCDLDFSNPTHITRNAPASGYDDVNYPRGNGGYKTCPSETVSRNSNDEAYSIVQMNDGNLAISIRYNVIQLGAFGFFQMGSLCNAADSAGFDQILDCDAFIMIIDKSFTSSTSDLRQQHVAHLNGDDYTFSIALDYTGEKILGIGTNVDSLKKTNSITYDEMLLFQYDPDLSNSTGTIEWQGNYLGYSQSSVCGFTITANYKGGLVGAGNDYREDENFSWILMGRTCETNIMLTGSDLGPNKTDGITYSIKKQLQDLGSGSNELNMFTSRLINALIVVDSGYIWHIHSGCTINLPSNENKYDSAFISGYESQIIVRNGGKLIMDPGSTLTSYSGCGNTMWGGVRLAGNIISGVLNGAEMEMTEALIENAIVGIKALSGSSLKCVNSVNTTTQARPTVINFKNNRRSVEIHPWTSTPANHIYFKYVNFLGDAPLHEWNGKGIKDFISVWDFNGLKIWGSSFMNSYFMGSYSDDNRGSGITCFNLTADIIKGSNTSVNNGTCSYPTGLPNLFSGLDVGIWNGGNTLNELRIHGNNFINVGIGIYSGTGTSLKIYDNDFIWDGLFSHAPSGDANHVKAIHTVNVDGLNFDKNRINAQVNISPYTSMLLEEVVDVFFPSVIQKNNIWNNSGIGEFGIGMWNNNSGTNLDFLCNTYDNLEQDWFISSSFRSSIGSNNNPANGNQFTKSFSGTPDSRNIFYGGTPSVTYFSSKNLVFTNPLCPNFSSNPSGINFSTQYNSIGTDVNCSATNPCDRYLTVSESLFGGEHLGEVIVSKIPFHEALFALNRNQFDICRSKILEIPDTDSTQNKIRLLQILLTIFEENRPFKMTLSEREALASLTNGNQYENEYARNVLKFFAGIDLKSNLVVDKKMIPNIQTTTSRPTQNLLCQIYPNPNNGQLNVKIPHQENKNTTLYILDIMGKVVKSIELNDAESILDISDLGSGIYQIRIENKGNLLYIDLLSKF